MSQDKVNKVPMSPVKTEISKLIRPGVPENSVLSYHQKSIQTRPILWTQMKLLFRLQLLSVTSDQRSVCYKTQCC